MILPLLALAAAAQAAAPADEARFTECSKLAKSDAARAESSANDWLAHGGGLHARQCLGLAYIAQERWAPAAVVFEQAAREAESRQDPRRADFWVESGNSWLAANDGAKARTAFDAALGTAALAPQMRGEVQFDRARADVLLDDLAGARADIDKGLALVPQDAFGWYLSAALAMRQEALPRAQQDIAKAVQLAPDDPDVLLLAGNIAGASGENEAARGFFTRVLKEAPDSPAGKSAQAALAENSVDDAAPVAPPPESAPSTVPAAPPKR